MAVTPILIDRARRFDETPANSSVLLSLLGTRTTFAHLLAALKRSDIHDPIIVPAFDAGEVYSAAIQRIAPQARILGIGEVATLIEALEPADWVLMIDASVRPVGGYSFESLLRSRSDCPLVKHQIHLRRDAEGLQERVVRDGASRVRCVQRLYDGVTRLETDAIGASLFLGIVPVVSLGLHSLSLGELRIRLVHDGIPTRDLAAETPAYDLADKDDYQAAVGEALYQKTLAPVTSAAWRCTAADVWVSAGAQVSDGARLVGPLVVHDGAQVAPGAVVVGPAIIGPHARVEADAVVCQSVVESGATVPERASLVADVIPPPHRHAFVTPQQPTGGSADFRPGGASGKGAAASRSASNAALTPRALAIKRAIDACAAGFGLLLLMPLLAVVALLVKLTSRGPVFFGHEREGLNGRVFRCWKFRTMVPNAHLLQRALYAKSNVDGPQFKMERDPRVTWIGNWLRKTNIDELPQLWNVLRGEMSLIGPRPSPFRENQICVPWRQARLSHRPGITGLWQVCRHERDAGDFHQWIHFDTLYVRHWSLLLDLRILLCTVLTLGGRWSVPLSWILPRGAAGANRTASALMPIS